MHRFDDHEITVLGYKGAIVRVDSVGCVDRLEFLFETDRRLG